MQYKNHMCITCGEKQLVSFEYTTDYYRCALCGTDYKTEKLELVCIFFPEFIKVFKYHWEKNKVFLYKLSKYEFDSLIIQAEL